MVGISLDSCPLFNSSCQFMHDLYIAKSTVFSVPFPLDLLGVCSAGATLRS